MMGWGQYGWGMGLGWIWMVVIWALAITGIVYFVRSLTNRSKKTDRDGAPYDMINH